MIDLLGVSFLIRLKNAQDELSSRLSQEYKVCIYRQSFGFDSKAVQEGIISLHGYIILMEKSSLPEHTLVRCFSGPYQMY